MRSAEIKIATESGQSGTASIARDKKGVRLQTNFGPEYPRACYRLENALRTEDGRLKLVSRPGAPYGLELTAEATRAVEEAAGHLSYEAPQTDPRQAEIDKRVRAHEETRRRDERSSGNFGQFT